MRLPCGYCELLSTTDSLLRCRSSPVGLRHFYFKLTFYRTEFPKAQHLRATSTWWTGEDSNLRSPQGAADLQSAGFSHSPTRPRKFVVHAKRKSSKHLSENAAGGKRKHKTDSCLKTPARQFCL